MTDVDAPTEEYTRQRVEHWKLIKLHWVRDHLEGARRNLYDELLARYDEPELADVNVRFSMGFRGDESPLTLEELSAETFEQAVDTVSSWRAEGSSFTGPSFTGLGSVFEQYVAAKPEEYSAKARVLVGRPAVFVRGFLRRMSEALKSGRAVDLDAVLDVCSWVVSRPVEERTVPMEGCDRGTDVDWQWTRDEICQLVEHVCTAREESAPKYPLKYRERLWGLLESIYRDRPQSYMIYDPAEVDPRTRDYLDIGINSARGKAVEAALEYARWIGAHKKQSQGTREAVPGGFESMPEVRDMLEWQIAPENSSVEAMSIIGSRVGLIDWIDRGWLRDNAERIFGLQEVERGIASAPGWAAWNAFLVWGIPYFELYEILRSQFAFAVEQAARVRLPEQSRHQPMARLGEHLMVLYGRGQLGLDDDDRLLLRFLDTAAPEIRRHAIGFVGGALEGEERIPEDIIDRFERLWDYYWAGRGKKDVEESPGAWLFGTWFSGGKFHDAWALERLRQFVEVDPTPEPDHSIIERLVVVADIDITKSVEILDRMVRGDQEGWRVNGWGDAPKQILTKAMKAGGKARDTAEKLIDYLGRRGYMDFGRLLSPPPPNA